MFLLDPKQETRTITKMSTTRRQHHKNDENTTTPPFRCMKACSPKMLSSTFLHSKCCVPHMLCFNSLEGNKGVRLRGLSIGNAMKNWTTVISPSPKCLQEASIMCCDLFRPKNAKKRQKLSPQMTPSTLKNALLASCDGIVSSQICGSKLQRLFHMR